MQKTHENRINKVVFSLVTEWRGQPLIQKLENLKKLKKHLEGVSTEIQKKIEILEKQND